jgi:hypothetical protein
LASTRTERSPATPSQSDEGIVELVPPADSGFSGTAKLRAQADSALVQELLKRGYTVKAA